MSNTYKHADGTECLWDVHDQAWYPMHPLYPMSRPCHQNHEPRCEGLAPFRCGNPSCPAHGRCGDRAPQIVPGAPTHCALPHGHPGWHKGDDGSEWTRDSLAGEAENA